MVKVIFGQTTLKLSFSFVCEGVESLTSASFSNCKEAEGEGVEIGEKPFSSLTISPNSCLILPKRPVRFDLNSKRITFFPITLKKIERLKRNCSKSLLI